MKTLIKLICIVVLTLSLNSCSTFKITTAGHETVEEITTLNQLRWEMQTDWRYRPYQPYSWYNNYYSNNFMWQYGYSSHWNFYNRHDLWWNWWGQNWYSPWYLNVYNNWNGYGWNSWYQTPHYVYGRRGSRGRSNTGVYSYTNRTNKSRLLIDSKVSTSESRTYILNTASPILNTFPRNTTRPRVQPNTKPPVIINKPPRVIQNNTRPIINNSSSRPNLNNTNSRPSVPQTTTKSPRKAKRNN